MNARSMMTAVLSVLLVTISVTVNADTQDIVISDAWARSSAPGAPSAGFITVTNTGKTDDILLDVSGDFAKKLELHITKAVDGVMKMMHQKDGVVIPAGDQVQFKPGSYHLMFMGLDKNFVEGERYTVTLTFANAGEVEVTLPVKKMAMNAM